MVTVFVLCISIVAHIPVTTDYTAQVLKSNLEVNKRQLLQSPTLQHYSTTLLQYSDVQHSTIEKNDLIEKDECLDIHMHTQANKQTNKQTNKHIHIHLHTHTHKKQLQTHIHASEVHVPVYMWYNQFSLWHASPPFCVYVTYTSTVVQCYTVHALAMLYALKPLYSCFSLTCQTPPMASTRKGFR